MAVYRQVQTNYWHDSFVMELTPEERYFYIYLLTNSETTQSGIFEIHNRMMEMDLGYNRETIEKLIKRFEEYGKIMYCEETREIMIINWMKYNFINSRNTILCINKELKEVKNGEFLRALYKICLNKGYDVEAIFQGIVLNIEENQELHMGLEGACKDLGEEEAKEEIQEEASKKEEVIDNSTENKLKNKSKQEEPTKVLEEFKKNIRKPTRKDKKKIMCWIKEFEEEVIIQAILEAVKYNAAHIGYIESVLENWRTLSLFTIEKFKAYRSKGNKEKQDNRCNADAYKYVD